MKWLKGQKEISLQLEIFKLIRHPMTPAISIVAFTLLALLFYRLCVDYLQVAHSALQQRELATSVSLAIIKPFFSWSIIIFSMILPLFSTAAFSQEYRQQTFYLWACGPLSANSVVIGKFFTQLLIVTFLLLIMCGMVLSLAWETTLDWGMVASAFTCVLLISSCLASFNLFISSCIQQPILAITLSFIGNLLWMMFEWLNPFSQAGWFIGKELALLAHAEHLMNGILTSDDITYFFVFTCFWLLLTMQRMNQRFKALAS